VAKEVVNTIKLQIPGGQATLVPPVGPALGQAGINPGEFISRFNQATSDLNGTIVPVVVSVYRDKSFDFVVKKPPAAVLLKQAAGIAKGAGAPGREMVASVTREQIRQIAETKLPDLGVDSLEKAMRVIEGTARSMGVEVVET
jgi:large subunit ribosomal protein L11